MAKKIWKWLIHNYRVTIIDHESLLQRRAYITSRFSVLLLFGLLFAFLVGGSVSLVVFTGLREWIPGYTNPQLVQEVDTLRGKVLQLQRVVGDYETYLASISEIAGVDQKSLPTNQQSKPKSSISQTPANQPSFDVNPSLGSEPAGASAKEGKSKASLASTVFFRPSRGVLRYPFSLVNGHLGVDIITAKKENISSVADGFVLYTGFSAREGFVVLIDHGSGVISAYKNLGRLFVESGDFLGSGASIGIIGDQGENLKVSNLHFELWSAGKAVDPSHYINLN